MVEKNNTRSPQAKWLSIGVFSAVASSAILLISLHYKHGLGSSRGGRENGIALAARNAKDARDAGGEASSVEEEYTVGQDSSVYLTLRLEAKLENTEIQEILAAAEPLVTLDKIQSGTKIILTREVSSQERTKLAFILSPVTTLELRPNLDLSWTGALLHKQIDTKEFVFAGTVEDNLWNSAVNSGLDGTTVYTFADIFSGQIDFYREVQPGDSWRVLIERQFIEGKPYQWGNILAAEYRKSEEQFVAIRFEQADGSAAYYDQKGISVVSAFLKSPIPYSRISSRFAQRRFHPILKINRPHLGVDYAAAHGTPVRAVGDGRVTTAGRASSNGIMVKIEHSTLHQTAYKHLSRLGKGVKKNVLVKQGQIIGYVGATGLATGPHLHFEFYENGVYKDPLGKRFPRMKTIAQKELPAFKQRAENLVQRLARSPDAAPEMANLHLPNPIPQGI
jgi:murein DD-endopeptidase MepM/ murein hydrolase activator NlpD